MSEACTFCGVRADVGCQHRTAEGPQPPAIADPREKLNRSRDPRPGAGFNFRASKKARSWGIG